MIGAISTGPVTHLDHLAPLCHILDIPLIVLDSDQCALGKQFYPMIDFRYIPPAKLTLPFIAEHFDTILTCGKFWAMELGAALQLVMKKKVRFIFAPHGYSDKEDFLQAPVAQDIELVYNSQDKEKIATHNHRLWFYKKFKDHFDQLAKPFFDTEKPTVLYAPTFETKATTTSFFSQTDEVIKQCKDKAHLLIKLHPQLEENDPARFFYIIGKYENEVTFIQDFPPVYPLLDKTDIYLGDFSSVGYDFLHYDRPMFFLKQGGKLQSCGEPFEGDILKDQDHLSNDRRKLYTETFGPKCDPEKIFSRLMMSRK